MDATASATEKEIVEGTYAKHRFNSVLLINLYTEPAATAMAGTVTMRKSWVTKPIIASLSLGQTRRFKLRHKFNRELSVINLDLTSGSLLCMSGLSQSHWQHCVPKTARDCRAPNQPDLQEYPAWPELSAHAASALYLPAIARTYIRSQPVPTCLIIQHPSETRHPINSARIADLGIRNCEILVGEDFSDSAALKERLANRQACLLFPSENALTINSYVAERGKPDLCIVLDGTWRKAKKIYFMNPVLQSLPAVTLSETHTSTYTIRKSPGEGALSTIEASVAFLREISQDEKSHQNCLDAFNRMINRQIEAMGADTFKKNYSKRL